MPTLLMRLRAPMMSWGDHSQFGHRDSRCEPTKSAVIGLLCAALGRPRWEPVHDLAALKMGVRVNKEGILQQDYHTVQDNIRDKNKATTTLSDRYYVADADYLVGLEGDNALLKELDNALQKPVWQLYFGRKSFVPSCPIRVGIDKRDLEESLRDLNQYPPRLDRKPPQKLRLLLEVGDSNDVRRDVPIEWQKRLFGIRCVDTTFLELPDTTKSLNLKGE